MTVVLLTQLPFSPEHMHLKRRDMFNMHLLIPLLTVVSFLTNDSPVGKLKPLKRLHGTWFVTLYAVTVIALILKGVIPREQIPYFFLDITHIPALALIGCAVFLYGLGYLLSWGLSEGNRKLSWLWFRDVAKAAKQSDP